MKIVSHLPPRHLDDYLALCILRNLFPEAEVEFVYPPEVPLEYLIDPDTILVDVGQNYNPMKNNYDHHQDINTPCSVLLVLRHFGPYLSVKNLNAPFLQTIDIIDRFGVDEALKRGMMKQNSEMPEKLNVILRTKMTPFVTNTVAEAMKDCSYGGKDYEFFVEFVYWLLSDSEEFNAARDEFEREKREFEERLKDISIIRIDDLKVCFSPHSLYLNHGKIFREMGVDLLIERNSMKTEHTSMIINSSSNNIEKAIALREKLVKNRKVVYRHPAGFIIVVGEPVENFLRT